MKGNRETNITDCTFTMVRSGDSSFASQRVFDAHNNLSAMNNGHHNNNIHGNMKLPGKSVHFQNIRADHSGFGQMVSQNPPTTFTSRSPRSPILPGLPANKTGFILPRYASNVISEEEGSFVNLHTNTANSGRCSNPNSKELEFHRNKIMSENFAAKPYNRHLSSVSPTPEYTDMSKRRSPISQKSNSNSCLDGAEGWDGDTTTSGSYTVDPHELCDEIDKLFFDEFQDVVV